MLTPIHAIAVALGLALSHQCNRVNIYSRATHSGVVGISVYLLV